MADQQFIDALEALKTQLARATHPAAEACHLSGQKVVVAWGVDLGLSELIPLKAAYWLLLQRIGEPAGRTSDFNTASARRHFQDLGLKAVKKPAAFWKELLAAQDVPVEIEIPAFEYGKAYNRRALHQELGGQEQGGIITPTEYPVVIAVSGASGKKHGYLDEWTNDGVFLLFGEGQRGDMSFDSGNKAIRDHVKDGKALYLFLTTKKKGEIRFAGEFNCDSYHLEQAKDSDDKRRSAIVFHLVPLEAMSTAPPPDQPIKGPPNLLEMRAAALKAAGSAPPRSKQDVTTSVHQRSRTIAAFVLARAEGHCELCGAPAPFVRESGEPYLEAHHIKRLSDGGLDDPRSMGAICPNCHRAAHYSVLRVSLNERLQAIVDKRDGAIANGN